MQIEIAKGRGCMKRKNLEIIFETIQNTLEYSNIGRIFRFSNSYSGQRSGAISSRVSLQCGRDARGSDLFLGDAACISFRECQR